MSPQVRKWGLLECLSGVVLGEEHSSDSSSLTQLWKAVLKKRRKEGKRGEGKKEKRKEGKGRKEEDRKERERKRGRGKVTP